MKGPVIRRFRLSGGREIVSLRPDVHERALAKANETLARSYAMTREQQKALCEGAQERMEGYVRKWLDDPEFKASLYRRRDELVDAAHSRESSWVQEDPYFCGDPTPHRPSWLRRLLGRVR